MPVALFSQQEAYSEIKDIPYREQASDKYAQERCKVDLYYPLEKSGYATVVWFHGGGLTSGSKFIPNELKNCGLAVVAVNYRLLPNCTPSDCIDAAAAAAAVPFRVLG